MGHPVLLAEDEHWRQLLAHCAELLGLATRSLGAMAAAAEQHKLKAMRNAAAQRAAASIELLRTTLRHVAERGVAVAAPPTQQATLDELAARLAPLLPGPAVESDDEEYY